MKQAFKYRIYPTPDQAQELVATFGASRFIYNWGLSQRSEQYRVTGKSEGYCKLAKAMTVLKQQLGTKWLYEYSNMVLQQSLRDLDNDFTRFFKKQSMYPSFKCKHHNKGSARYQRDGFRIKNGNIYLARMITGIKVRWSQDLPDMNPSNVTVSVTPSGKFYASFLCEVADKMLDPINQEVGIDLGITAFVTLSDGEKVYQPKSIKKARTRVAKVQRQLSRKKKGSKNRVKARIKVARAHEKISNIRKDFLHKLSTKVVHENQVIALEDLNVSGMVKNRSLARSISEQGWRDFRSMLQYKSDWYGRKLVVIDRFFPSSKTCSACGKVQSKLPLNIREWKCSCRAIHDRDVNAAINILAAGHVVLACGVDGRPVAG